MYRFDRSKLKKLYIPPPFSHKGQNGKVMVIAGSSLFHAAALWALEAASYIADMVYFASTKENNAIVQQAKYEFRNGIVVPRSKIEEYIQEADSILIGPGLPRKEGIESGDDDTRKITNLFLHKYSEKKWVIDGGSLQVMDASWIPPFSIVTPHRGEYKKLFGRTLSPHLSKKDIDHIKKQAKAHNAVILVKGREDIICTSEKCTLVRGGNQGMTKGGTGDVLAGVAAGLYAVNDDPFLVAQAASFFNKKAGERLFKKKGYWYNTRDILDEIPRVMRDYILS